MKSGKHLLYTALSTFTALTVTVSMIPVALAANDTSTASSDTAVTVTIPESVDKTYVMSEENNQVKITESCVYKITGSCSDGNIVVKKGTTGVTLILEDLTLTSTTGATLSCNKSSEVTVYVSGSVTLTDNETDESSDDYDGAAIKAKAGSTLIITGTGTLNIDGNAKNGIKGSDADADEGLAAAVITVAGATIDIDAENDGINSGGDLILAGGTITVSAGDDGIHSDAGLYLNGANVTVTDSNEGLEGAAIELNAGTGYITASDDGVNAAADGAASSLTINGGYWWINAGGDGLDAGGDSNGDNGTITMNGGTVEVYGAANNGNAALDAGRGITYNGGTLLAVGMSGMAETPSGSNVLVFGSAGMGGGLMGGVNGPQGQAPQDNGGMGAGRMSFTSNSIQNAPFGGMQGGGLTGGMQQGGAFGGQQSFGQNNKQNAQFGQQSNGSVSISAGSTIVIKDASGNTIYTATGMKSANSVVFASDSLTEGSEYTLYVDGNAVATATAGSDATGGMMQQPGQMPQQGQQPQMGGQQSGPMGGMMR